jgi:hypothetical protein
LNIKIEPNIISFVTPDKAPVRVSVPIMKQNQPNIVNSLFAFIPAPSQNALLWLRLATFNFPSP